MKNIYKRISRSTIITILILTSCVFLTNLCTAPKGVQEPAPEVSAGSVTPEMPQEPEAPEDLEEEGPREAPEAEPEPSLMATTHFAMAEYACDCAGYCDGWPCVMEPELLEKIEALRCYFGRPIIITSGVRCAARNEEVGGVSWSFHKRGCAADLYCPGVGVGDLAAGAKDCGLNVLPYYSSGYIHVEI